jgi:hypothetical protein
MITTKVKDYEILFLKIQLKFMQKVKFGARYPSHPPRQVIEVSYRRFEGQGYNPLRSVGGLSMKIPSRR